MKQFLFEVSYHENGVELICRFSHYSSALDYLEFVLKHSTDDFPVLSGMIIGYYLDNTYSFGSRFCYAYSESLTYHKGDSCLTSEEVIRNEFPKDNDPFAIEWNSKERQRWRSFPFFACLFGYARLNI